MRTHTHQCMQGKFLILGYRGAGINAYAQTGGWNQEQRSE